MKMYWNYTPSPVDQCAAETWIDANDCTVVDTIMIGEHSLAACANRPYGERSPIVNVKRHSDLAADLSMALVDLRFHLPPVIASPWATSY